MMGSCTQPSYTSALNHHTHLHSTIIHICTQPSYTSALNHHTHLHTQAAASSTAALRHHRHARCAPAPCCALLLAASPKSHSLSFHALSRRQLAGLMSLWMTAGLRECRYTSARARSVARATTLQQPGHVSMGGVHERLCWWGTSA
jgi:hypothetical protein